MAYIKFTVRPKEFLGEQPPILEYPDDKKEPFVLYRKDSKFVEGTVYVIVEGPGVFETAKSGISIEIFDMETDQNLRGIHLKMFVWDKPKRQIDLMISGYNMRPDTTMFKKLWKFTPFSFFKTISEIEKKVVLENEFQHEPWFEQFMIEQHVQPKMSVSKMFELLEKIK